MNRPTGGRPSRSFSSLQFASSSAHQFTSWNQGDPVPRVKLTKPAKVLLWAMQLYLVVLLVLILVRFLRVVG
jgi:hypothetical protein